MSFHRPKKSIRALVLGFILCSCLDTTPLNTVPAHVLVTKPNAPSCTPNPCTESPGRTLCKLSPLGTECRCNEYYEENTAEGCTERIIPHPGIASSGIDWSATSPTFAAKIRVLNPLYQGVPGIKVVTDGYQYTTDELGWVEIDLLDANTSFPVSIEANGFAPLAFTINAYSSGFKPLEVILSPLNPAVLIPMVGGGAIQAHNVQIFFPASAFLNANGQLSDGFIQTTAPGDFLNPDRPPQGKYMGRNLSGEDFALELFQRVTINGEDEAGTPVWMYPGKYMQVVFDLPKNVEEDPGSTLGLWFYEPSTHRWIQHGTCQVSDIEEEHLSCTGSIGYLGIWGVGLPRPNACIHFDSALHLPARYELKASSHWVQSCTHEDTGVSCSGSLLNYGDGFALRAPQGEEGTESLCALKLFSHEGSHWIRVVSAYLLNSRSAESEENRKPETRWYLHASDPFEFVADYDTFPGIIDAHMRCETPGGCTSVQWIAEFTDLIKLHQIDADKDGWFGLGVENSELTAELAEVVQHLGDKESYVDCNDDDDTIYPGAEDAPCDGVDSSCDGGWEPAATQERLQWQECTPDSSTLCTGPAEWNAFCASNAQCQQPGLDEKPGNAFDENCDGLLMDRDGDGWLAPAEAPESQQITWDCDDSRAGAHPNGTEIAGNPVDEDCDGVVPDRDGDGWFSPGHALMEGIPMDKAWDCDDDQFETQPGKVSNESTLSAFYKENPEGERVRSSEFCSLFDTNGNITQKFRWLFQDRNCDGYYSDLDGDGWTVPGDHSKGAEFAWDCDDLDPRIHPRTPDPEGHAVLCETLPFENPADDEHWLPADLVNESDCQVNRAPFGGGIPENESQWLVQGTCPVAPGGGKTFCVEVIENVGDQKMFWGQHSCTLSSTINEPLMPAAPGKTWGPCGAEPYSCEPGLICLLMSFSNSYKAWLDARSWDRSETGYQGMCHPICSFQRAQIDINGITLMLTTKFSATWNGEQLLLHMHRTFPNSERPGEGIDLIVSGVELSSDLLPGTITENSTHATLSLTRSVGDHTTEALSYGLTLQEFSPSSSHIRGTFEATMDDGVVLSNGSFYMPFSQSDSK